MPQVDGRASLERRLNVWGDEQEGGGKVGKVERKGLWACWGNGRGRNDGRRGLGGGVDLDLRGFCGLSGRLGGLGGLDGESGRVRIRGKGSSVAVLRFWPLQGGHGGGFDRDEVSRL